ncbi:unnamed protein product [Penicillium nalgiovense]|uniref:PRISE-like Rossmann-fold domain-containing protein n=1 Tax=Penicillium nalgiovense TaxID=60175 RepID=A0A1V6YFH3_PENNA|nr:hypothetical protein PENNAL_c0022G06149 [Penicillium nalgiovense]CAG7963269.1 unnamed protein product [Penicillium nalgiovense]CAG7969305.1 unnamed protein product [Penicillium nalgiovense]CAG7977280.1 unnamed protein product [Penicillium nalgiovense]CAG8025811.1 unnamed protein product [Penicillium nalgiovense]
MAQTGKHALIFGASGISGWALLNQTLQYPTPTTFSRVTGLCNQPWIKKDTYISDDQRLNIVSGIDLTQSVEVVKAQLKEKVEKVESVDVVFFCAYIQTGDFQSLRKINTDLLQTAVQAISAVSPTMEAVILQTGGKGYGLEFPKEVSIQPPLHEKMSRIPSPWRENIFYYDQYDLLKKLSKDQNWTFSEIRPDGIVGFAPGSNVMNMAHGIAFYLTLYREVNGKDAKVPFPGRPHGYHTRHTDTFQDILAKMEIFAALNRDKCRNGSSFNCGDGEAATWAQVWPGICAYFGLSGVEPDGKQKNMQDFVSENKTIWDRLVLTHGLKKGLIESQNWGHVNFMLVDFDFAREYSLEAARSVGFNEQIDTLQGYHVTFDRMVKAKFIPTPSS